MILDSSALFALVFRESGYAEILDAVSQSEWVGIGAPTLAETGIVLSARLGADAKPTLALLLEHLDLRILPFEAVHARAARDAFERFGRGRHPADLNFGDCLTYAVAKVSGAPLLFVGDDFARTDVERALEPGRNPG